MPGDTLHLWSNVYGLTDRGATLRIRTACGIVVREERTTVQAEDVTCRRCQRTREMPEEQRVCAYVQAGRLARSARDTGWGLAEATLLACMDDLWEEMGDDEREAARPLLLGAMGVAR